MGSSSSKRNPSEVTWADVTGDGIPEDLDTAANSEGPKGLSRAAYARKVFVATKTGYLMKKSGMELGENSGGSGLGKIKFMNYVAKKRFVVLTGTSLMYHRDHKNLDDPTSSKEILLEGDNEVTTCNMPNSLFGIELIADGKATQLGAKDEQERQEWLVAISAAIRKLHGKKRGYLLKLRAGVPTPSPLPLPKAPLAASVERGDFTHASDSLLEGKRGIGEWTPKYFMLDDGKLTFHASHSSTLVVQGSFKLPRTTQVEVRRKLLLVVRNGANELVCRAAEERDLSSWENAINEAVQENARRRSKALEERVARGEDPLVVAEDLDDFSEDRTSSLTDSWTGARGISVEDSSVIRSKGFDATQGGNFSGLERVGGGGALLKGDLMTRPFSGDGPWRAAHYVLEKGRLLLFEDRHHVRPKQMHKISPSCAVLETNLKAYSFELVVSGRVLHLQGSSFEDSLRWIATLKAAINNSPPDDTDPLLAEALKLEDTFYYADFETKQSLGVVLERSKEWAIVKQANPQLSQVSVGSALASVNGESVVLRAYDDTIAMLTGWKPPLNLIFRRAPVKEGMVKRFTKSEKQKGATKWKQTWLDLREGKLSWFKLSPGGVPVGVIPMIGSAVALLPPNQANAANCFSVAGGVTSVTFQAPSRQEMISWAAHIYQASAVANGGGYLLDQEKDQEIAYEEERRRRLEIEEAERERFVKSKQHQVEPLKDDGPDEQGGTDEICASDTETAENDRKKEREDGSEAGDAVLVVVKDDAEETPAMVTPSAMPNAVEGEQSESGTPHVSPVADRSSKGEGSRDIDSIGDEKPRAFSYDGALSPSISDSASNNDVSASGETVGVVDSISASNASYGDSSAVSKSENETVAVSPSSGEELRISSAPFAGSSQAAESRYLMGNGGSDNEQRTLDKKASLVMQRIQEREAAAAKAAQALAAAKVTSAGKVVLPAKPVHSGKVAVIGSVPLVKDLAEKLPPAQKSPKASEMVIAVQTSAAVVSPSLAALRQRKKLQGLTWDVKESGKAPGADKALSPSLIAARKRGLPDKSIWIGRASNGSARTGSGATVTVAPKASTGRRSSKDVGRRVEEEIPPSAERVMVDRERPPVSSIVIAPQKAAQAEKAVSPSLMAARVRGIPAKGAIGDIGAISFSSASDASPIGNSSFDNKGQALGSRGESGSDAFDDVTTAPIALSSGKGGHTMSPSLAAAHSRGLSDNIDWGPAVSRHSTSTAVDAVADKRSAFVNRPQTRASGSKELPRDKHPPKKAELTADKVPEGPEKTKELSATAKYKRALTSINNGRDDNHVDHRSDSCSSSTASEATKTDDKNWPARRHDPSNKEQNASPPPKQQGRQRWQPSPTGRNGKGSLTKLKPEDVAAAASTREISPSFSGTTARKGLSPTPSGGKSLSPTPSPGAGGAAAQVASQTCIRAPKSDISDAGGVSVKELRSKLFGSGGIGGGFDETNDGLGLTRTVKPGPREPARGPIGGPWDEEKILEWVRDVTKMDIDPECGVFFSLKSGVELCRLIRVLKPDEDIPAPNDSTLVYKQLANIRSFLRSCRNLGLGASILFEPADLHEERDIPAVVKTLVALGESVPRTCPKFTGPKLNMKKFSWSTITTTTPAATTCFCSNSTRLTSSSQPIAKTLSRERSTAIFSNGSRGLVRGSGWPPGGSTGSCGGGVVATFVARNGGIGSTGSNGNSAVKVVGNLHRVWRGGEGGYHEPEISGDDRDSDDDYDYEEEEEEDYDDESVIRGDEYDMETEDEELTDEILVNAFQSVVSGGDGMSPLQFASLWRSLCGGKENFFLEMEIFRKFNTTGGSIMGFEDFKAGFRLLAEENAREHELVLSNLRGWSASY